MNCGRTAGVSMTALANRAILKFLATVAKTAARERRDRSLTLYMNDSDFDRLADFAAANKVPVGHVVREALRLEMIECQN